MILLSDHWDTIDTERYHYVMDSKGLFNLVDLNHRAACLSKDDLQRILRGEIRASALFVKHPKTVAKFDRHFLCDYFDSKLVHSDGESYIEISHTNYHTGEPAEFTFETKTLIEYYASGVNARTSFINALDKIGLQCSQRVGDNSQLLILALLCPHLIYRR